MIQANGISAGYGSHPVLNGISLSAVKGEFVAVIGPNGCGKTTLLRSLAGLIPFRGEVQIDGVSIRKMSRRDLGKKIALLTQAGQIPSGFSVYETVMMGRYAHLPKSFFTLPTNESREKVKEILTVLELWNDRARDIGELSGGQLQRVFLARALVQDPSVLLLDEPTNHLDLRFQLEMMELLRSWSKQEERIVIGVLHDMSLALRFADRLLLLSDGHIVSEGAATDVLDSPALIHAFQMDVTQYMREVMLLWKKK